MQNYIDNTGVQVADVVIGFVFLEKMNLDDIVELDAKLLETGKTFDYYCWDLYAGVGQEYKHNEELKAKRAEILHSIEEGGNETAALADYVVLRNKQCLLATMEGFRFAMICCRANPTFCIFISGKRLLGKCRNSGNSSRNRRQKRRLLGNAVRSQPERRTRRR